MDGQKEREGRGGRGGEKNKVSWPGSARDFFLCGSHTLTEAPLFLCPVHPFSPRPREDHTNTKWFHDLISERMLERMRVESVLLFSFLGCYCGGCVGAKVGARERPLFAWVNVLCRTDWVTAGMFNPKNLFTTESSVTPTTNPLWGSSMF